MRSESSSLFTGFSCGMDRPMKVSPSVKPADEELVAWACDGSHEAFEELIERHKQKAYRIAFGFARDREAAKDLSQDAFLKAFINLKNFDGRSGFYTWFYRFWSTSV